MYRNNSNSSTLSALDCKAESTILKRGNSRGFDQMTPLPEDFEPKDDDCLVGRRKMYKEAIGNQRFKEIVSTKLDAYLLAVSRLEKSALIDEVIATVRRNANYPNGGFVKQHPQTKCWYEVGDFLAKEKTAQAFRDALHEYYASSNPSKKKRNMKRKHSRQDNDSITTTATSASAEVHSPQTKRAKQSAIESEQCNPMRSTSLATALHTTFDTRHASFVASSANLSLDNTPSTSLAFPPSRQATSPVSALLGSIPTTLNQLQAKATQRPSVVSVGTSNNSKIVRNSLLVDDDELKQLSAVIVETDVDIHNEEGSDDTSKGSLALDFIMDVLTTDDLYEPIPLSHYDETPISKITYQ